ncbi:HAD family phosphatase [Macrococcus hajekii]|uniref:HAD family phosphatase n=1 Tax=Macrococcus hajekii TaxID=198482 RepID=A0A4R6BNU3_9STAP|nr:Cof-type HAD-IIB family hydrolase [Macrococcus hajekii]TDM03448.1 HAD family phosphatase [Macrococcus hajekii]GGA98969.1 phosphatase [Macrococcus hajekii]
MTEKHLICLDLDGTLLTDDKTVLPYTKQILAQLKKEGHEVIISTGRPYRASESYYHELGLDAPIVNFNGAFIHHPTDDSFKEVHSPLDLDIARDIFKHVEHLNIQNIIAEVKDNVFLHYHDELLFEGFSMGNPIVKSGDLSMNLQECPTSILIQAEEQHVPAIRAHLSDVYAEQIEHRRWGAPYPVIELVRTGISKAVGIQYISEYLNIKQENIIAFGDEDNDFEMIEYAGTGVAMGNAIQALKEKADTITLSNDEDGIGQFLAQYFNI